MRGMEKREEEQIMEEWTKCRTRGGSRLRVACCDSVVDRGRNGNGGGGEGKGCGDDR